MIQIERLDHLVLTVHDLPATVDFYTRVLGMVEVTFGPNRKALFFGRQRIHLHQRGREFEPKAAYPTAGSGDLCFTATTPMAEIMEHLAQCNVPILEGPVERAGALGTMISVYLRDPDQNLIEISNYLEQ
ncbi:MAG: VOC family protein [Caldilineaceae bacterium]